MSICKCEIDRILLSVKIILSIEYSYLWHVKYILTCLMFYNRGTKYRFLT